MRIDLDPAAMRALLGQPAVTDETMRIAESKVAVARRLARKKSGAMARKIIASPGRDMTGPYAAVRSTVRNRYGYRYGRLWEFRERYIQRSVE